MPSSGAGCSFMECEGTTTSNDECTYVVYDAQEGAVVRTGRPKADVPEPVEIITRRVQQLVNEAHGGNVLEASNVSGVPAATLRALFNGKSLNPGRNTLNALREPYNLPPGWFDLEESSHHPLHGYSFTLMKDRGDGEMYEADRFGIPWSSWPLPGVYKRLYAHVSALPRSDKRPIIGARDLENRTKESEARALVAEFLLSPLIEEEKAFKVKLVPEHPYEAREPAIVERLRLLGLFWQDALGPVIRSPSGAESAVGSPEV